MQYYHNPENLDEEEIISCLQRIFAAVRVSNLKILGGEPFVCQKKLIRILEYLKEAESRFDEAEIITNGTILPSEECTLVLKNTPKLKVVFSNYGELSSRLEEFKGICEREGIGCDVVEDEFWWDFGAPEFHDEKEKKTQHRYDGCYSRRLCTSLYRGRLYVCPRQAHGTHLGLIREDENETVNVMSGEFAAPDKMNKAIYKLIDRKEYITACRYCGCDAGIKIPRAVQAERPLDVNR